jgi:hypothetical protein
MPPQLFDERVDYDDLVGMEHEEGEDGSKFGGGRGTRPTAAINPETP